MIMTTQTEAIAAGVLQSLGTAGAAVAGANPQVAAVVALAPVAIQLLQSATQLQQAGVLPPDQLAALFAKVGEGIQSTHERWAAMNAADAAKA
jgi:hypothetical protein